MILGLLLLTAGVAHAETGTTFTMGEGNRSCGQLIAALGDTPPGKYREMNTASGVLINEYKAYQEWLLGFVSGFNASHDIEQQVKVDLAGMDLWMRSWCYQHLTESVFQGAMAFIKEEIRIEAATGRR
jgi:hypothetical protein